MLTYTAGGYSCALESPLTLNLSIMPLIEALKIFLQNPPLEIDLFRLPYINLRC